MKYKVGDKVRIKSLDWYNKHTNDYGNVVCGNRCFNSRDKHQCGKIVTIEAVHRDCYLVKENNGYWNDIMIEGLVDEKPSNENKEQLLMIRPYTMEIVSHKDYEIIQIDGKFFLEKKKKEYPKTYEECCKVLGVNPYNYLTIRNVHCYDGEEETTKYERDILGKFDSLWELHICRDAYWKIAGDWNPDWTNSELKYCIKTIGNKTELVSEMNIRCVLAFPTEEMRDAFYENFKEEMENCKELL